MNFHDVWTALEADNFHATAAGILRRRILPDACCDMFLGIEKPSANRVFVLRIESSRVPDSAVLPIARGFEVRIQTLPDDPPGHSSVLLLQTTEAFRDIFTALVADVAAHIAPTQDHQAAVKNLLARLRRWQQFLERSGPDGLSDEAQRGLFGELWFASNFLLPVAGTHSITAWTGPSFAPQDFQLPGMAVEIKTTMAKEHQKLPITGEKQLEASEHLAIFLLHLSVNALRGTGTTLVALIEQLRTLFSGDTLSLTIFEDALLAAGYLDAHAQRYSRVGYLIREHHFFEIRDAFPRIVGADLRDGVGDISYSVSVAACLPYQVADADFVRLLTDHKP